MTDGNTNPYIYPNPKQITASHPHFSHRHSSFFTSPSMAPATIVTPYPTNTIVLRTRSSRHHPTSSPPAPPSHEFTARATNPRTHTHHHHFTVPPPPPPPPFPPSCGKELTNSPHSSPFHGLTTPVTVLDAFEIRAHREILFVKNMSRSAMSLMMQ
ncbi:hypothetical protein RND81_10G026500 [Saponaria officinalis]|uniref:Uncharacterized protein n=1 Tax=Saponaria officinalis TaxID=3572 RepID=A0AAW1HXW5_SAPOF